MRGFCRFIRVAAICVLSVVILSVSVSASFVPRVNIQKLKSGHAAVLINNRTVIVLRTYNGELSPDERATIAGQRLIALLQKGLRPEALSYEVTGNSARVKAGDSLILIATQAEARAQRTSPALLAGVWIRNIRSAMAIPPLSAKPAELLVPLGETRIISVELLISGGVTAEISNPSVATIESQGQAGRVVVRGVAPGNAIVSLRADEFSVQVSVAVRKYAAYPGSAPSAVVTGRDVPVAMLRRAAEDAARQAVYLEPGAVISSVTPHETPKRLTFGDCAQVPVLVVAKGAGYLPAHLTVPVRIENRALPVMPTKWIMYSNSPERVEKYQPLFTGKLNPGDEAARLLYHHQNMMGRDIGFTVEVMNPNAEPASLHVIEGIASPMVDTVMVGYLAGVAFLRNTHDHIGRVFELPPGTRRVLVSQRLPSVHTASGIMELRQMSGRPLIVKVTAKPEEQRAAADPEDVLLPGALGIADSVALSDHVYPEPVLDLETSYTVGKAWSFVRLGREALKHATQQKRLDGNYGVTYNIRASLVNPTPSPQTVEMLLEATAGEVYGAFYVGGSFVGVKNVKPPSEKTIATITVPAGGTQTVSIRTMPLSGSAYPATLIIRPSRMVTNVRTTGSS